MQKADQSFFLRTSQYAQEFCQGVSEGYRESSDAGRTLAWMEASIVLGGILGFLCWLSL